MSTSHIIIMIALAITLGILLVGVFGMARGGEFNKKYGNKLMRMRVIAQLLAILLILLFAIMSGE